MKTIKKLSLLFLATFVLWSCSNDDDGSTPTNPPSTLNIVETAQATADLSSLVAAVIEANLTTTLSGTGPFTVLAPTNDAFAEFLSENGWADVSEVPDDALEQVLLNHVISGPVTASDLIAGGAGYTSTLADGAGGQNLSIYYNTSAGVQFNSLATVTTADVSASNGIVHIVDKVITLPSIVDHAIANPGLSNLVAAVTRDDQTSVLGALTDATALDPLTVIAPVDTAFSAFLSDNGFADLAAVPADALSQTLLNHVLGGPILSTDLTSNVAGYANTKATGAAGNDMSIYYNTDNGVMFNGMSTVAIADIVATNGIVHAVDAVVTLPTVVTFATADPNFSTLATALTDLTPSTDFAGILSRTDTTVSNLDGINPYFTIFAPTNDAFAAITIPTDETVLTNVLLHHVITQSNVASGDLTPNGDTTAQSLQGDDITVTLPGTGTNIGDITDGAGNTDVGIIAVDVQAVNGVIHAVNKVLFPM